MITILGAKGTISNVENMLETVASLSKEHALSIQLLDAKMVYGEMHLQSAIHHAQRAFERQDSISATLAMEILLYASGEYQIKIALDKMGLKPNTSEQQIAVVVVGDGDQTPKLITELLAKLELVQDDSVLDGDAEVLKRFGIAQPEIEAVHPDKIGELILERVAMVDVKKK
jgi:KEOPS complex subunit Cgi121